jgi:hypothetical protein
VEFSVLCLFSRFVEVLPRHKGITQKSASKALERSQSDRRKANIYGE